MTLLSAFVFLLLADCAFSLVRFVLEKIRGYRTGGYSVLDDLDWVRRIFVDPILCLLVTLAVFLFGHWSEGVVALLLFNYGAVVELPKYWESRSCVHKKIIKAWKTPIKDWAD